MCRFNLPLASDGIRHEYGFSLEQIGDIISTTTLAYGFGMIINGLITDRIGGKRAMLIGAAGTVTMNFLFGVASFASWLWLFIAIRGVDGYLQAFGAPGMIKMNAAWFAHRERGRFSGIFGFMINLGMIGINTLGPALLAGFVFLGLISIPALHWRWLFWAPSIICAVVAVGMALTVKETPEEAGWVGVIADDTGHDTEGVRATFRQVLRATVRNPIVWVTACAYACTGAVRASVQNWWPIYMKDLYQLDIHSARFKLLGTLIPFVASSGSLVAGYVSDIVFKGRRAPVAAILYFTETAIILLAAQFHTANSAILFFLLISFTVNSTHSILGSAAPMDIGGRRFAGFVFGLIDSFQYFGASLAGHFLGKLLDKSMGYYFYFMAPFGVIGGILMLTILGKVTRVNPPKPAGVSA
jgi:MFS transporter, OPA family, glycerol-3-phosphate transporter